MMAKNPYANSNHLARLLWEAELVADRYSTGGLILIRTKDGWRAFLGTFKENWRKSVEKTLDKNVPSYEKAFTNDEPGRMPTLIDEFQRLLADCMVFPDYRPFTLLDELDEDT